MQDDFHGCGTLLVLKERLRRRVREITSCSAPTLSTREPMLSGPAAFLVLNLASWRFTCPTVRVKVGGAAGRLQRLHGCCSSSLGRSLTLETIEEAVHLVCQLVRARYGCVRRAVPCDLTDNFVCRFQWKKKISHKLTFYFYFF